MNGKAVARRGEKQVHDDILTGPRFGSAGTLPDDFREFVRNGLMHDAETRKRWLVEKTVPKLSMVGRSTNGDYRINRTKFHRALESTFEDWISKVRGGDAALRGKMRDRMNQIIAKHYAP